MFIITLVLLVGEAAMVPDPPYPLVTPPTAAAHSFQLLTGETRLTQLPRVFFEGVLRTLWSFICDAARSQIPAEDARKSLYCKVCFDADRLLQWIGGFVVWFVLAQLRASCWPLPSPQFTSLDSMSPLHQTFLQLRQSVRGFTGTIEPTFPRRMDVLRQPLSHLLPQPPLTFEQGRDAIRDVLAAHLLADITSDVAATGFEAHFVAWAARRSGASADARRLPVDLRRSLYNFLTVSCGALLIINYNIFY